MFSVTFVKAGHIWSPVLPDLVYSRASSDGGMQAVDAYFGFLMS